jgi:hypothetical protein
MFTVILSDESVSTFSLIYLCKSVSQKVFARFIDALVQVQLFGCGIIITTSPRWLIQSIPLTLRLAPGFEVAKW